MATTVKTLAELCDAQLTGNQAELVIESAANLDEAGAEQLTFVSNPKFAEKLQTTQASAVIVPAALATAAIRPGLCLLAVKDPELAFIRCLQHLYPTKRPPGTTSTQAVIDPTARVGEESCVEAFTSIGAHSRLGTQCWIMAGCRIGANVTLGNNCVLHPNVVLYDGVQLGDNVVIHAGSVIGSDGFGYKFRDGKHVKFSQVGNVVIESDVEIGANTCIDRAALGTTRIGQGTKIDNQVHIAHNVQIGAHTIICGQVGIGGSTTVKDYAMLISQCGIADHVTVGSQAVVLAQAGVTKDVGDKDQVMGFPAMNRKEWLQETATLRRLGSHKNAIAELIQLLPKLRESIDSE